MCVFEGDESGYAAWLRAHPHGYVFNHFGGSDARYNVLHRADCSWLARAVDEGRRTVVEKVCSEDITAIAKEANRLRAEEKGWKACATCMGAGSLAIWRRRESSPSPIRDHPRDPAWLHLLAASAHRRLDWIIQQALLALLRSQVALLTGRNLCLFLTALGEEEVNTVEGGPLTEVIATFAATAAENNVDRDFFEGVNKALFGAEERHEGNGSRGVNRRQVCQYLIRQSSSEDESVVLSFILEITALHRAYRDLASKSLPADGAEEVFWLHLKKMLSEKGSADLSACGPTGKM